MSKVICLTPIKNGEAYIENFFKENDPYVDFYIILDDNSTDTTLSLLKDRPKVLSILNRERADLFDDLLNRNILLAEAEKFANNLDWIVWLDIDEVLYKFEMPITDSPYSVLNFKLVHLWNSTTFYNTEYPYSNQGIQYKLRGFRVDNSICWKLPSVNRLHFSLLPPNFNQQTKIVPNGYILHHANITKERREARYLRYRKDDTDNKFQPTGYEHLLNDNPTLDNIANLKF